jgi:hypothetical protein
MLLYHEIFINGIAMMLLTNIVVIPFVFDQPHTIFPMMFNYSVAQVGWSGYLLILSYISFVMVLIRITSILCYISYYGITPLSCQKPYRTINNTFFVVVALLMKHDKFHIQLYNYQNRWKWFKLSKTNMCISMLFLDWSLNEFLHWWFSSIMSLTVQLQQVCCCCCTDEEKKGSPPPSTNIPKNKIPIHLYTN